MVKLLPPLCCGVNMSSSHGVIKERNQRSQECGREFHEAMVTTFDVLVSVTGATRASKLHVVLVRRVDVVAPGAVIEEPSHIPCG